MSVTAGHDEDAARGPRVLVVTTVHVPDDARILHRQVRSMLAAGFEVHVAAPWSDTGATPLAGVHALDLPRARGRRRLHALRAARRLLVDHGPRVDLVLVHDPELLLAVRSVGTARLAPVVWDVHEDLAASLRHRTWLPAIARGAAVRAVRALERWAEANVHLLLAEEGYRDRFAGEHPVVRNLPWTPVAGGDDDPTVRSGTGAIAVAPDAPGRVVQVGRLSRGRGLAELLELGRRLRPRGIVVELAGDPDDDVRAMLEDARDRGEVVWHGRVSNATIGGFLDGALAGLCLLHDEPNYRVSLPTKVPEYLVHGLPVIATPLPAVTALAARNDAIVPVGFGDVDAVEGAVVRLRDDPDERRRRSTAALAARRDLVWEPEADRFVALVRGWARR